MNTEKQWYNYRWDEGKQVIFGHVDYSPGLFANGALKGIMAVSDRLFLFMRGRG